MTVVHVLEEKRFLAIDESGCQIGFISYTGDAPTITAERTFVEEANRGQGVARRLLDALTEYAEENGLTIRPVCSYVKAAFAEAPEHYRKVAAG